MTLKDMTRKKMSRKDKVLAELTTLKQDQKRIRRLLLNLSRVFEQHLAEYEQAIDCRLSLVEVRVKKVRQIVGDEEHAAL